MEVIIDTCVIIDALFDLEENLSREEEINYDYCWEIIKLVRAKEIRPIISPQLHREYICTPQRLVKKAISENAHKANDPTQYCEALVERLCNASLDILKVIHSAKWVEVTSDQKICLRHPADDKLINLAVDSDCDIIITSNIDHVFEAVEKNTTTGKTKKPIIVLKPMEFCSYMKMNILPDAYKRIAMKTQNSFYK